MNVSRRFAAVVLLPALLSLFTIVLTAAPAPPSKYAPPPAVKPSAEVLKKIEERKDKLGRMIRQFRQLGVTDPFLADIEVYYKAASWITRHNEFYQKDAGDWTVEALERGLLRASQQAQGETPWYQIVGRTVVRGYRSQVDGSVQPYAVTFPADYGKERKKWRIEVVLHGRDNGLTEVSFLHRHNGDKPAPPNQDYVRLDIYGRGNNAYRWAGETDVSEAVEHFLLVEQKLTRAQQFLDVESQRAARLLDGRGRHLAPRPARPGHWCVISPGAGFTTTHGYIHEPAGQAAAVAGGVPAHLRRRRLRRERLRRAGRRLRRRRGSAIAGRAQHRGPPQGAEHPHETAGRAGARPSVPARVAEEGRRSARRSTRPRAGRSIRRASIS